MRLDRASWTPLPVFTAIASLGGVSDTEMCRTFNMGVGMVAVLAPEHRDAALRILRDAGVNAWICGAVIAGDGDVQIV